MSLTWETVEAIATDLGATRAQRRKWRQIGREVPPAWRIRIAGELAARGVLVELSVFDDLPPRPGKLSSHADADIGGVPGTASGKQSGTPPLKERKRTNA